MSTTLNKEKEEELFSAALILPISERQHCLGRACAHETHLRARLITLVDSFDESVLFVREPNATPLSQVGDRIGNFELHSVLGEGGVGVVYLAAQLAPVRRQVALKIIKPGMDSESVIDRFEIEQQALAM